MNLNFTVLLNFMQNNANLLNKPKNCAVIFEEWQGFNLQSRKKISLLLSTTKKGLKHFMPGISMEFGRKFQYSRHPAVPSLSP